MTLIIVNTIAVTLETVPSVAARHGDALWALEVFSVTIFSIEYALRVWVARDHPGHAPKPSLRARLIYLRSPLAIIDLVSILPFYLSMFISIDLRALRLLRVLRILKLTRYSPALRTMAAVARKEIRAILGALCILVVVVMIASTAIHLLEAPGQPGNIRYHPARHVVVDRDPHHRRLRRCHSPDRRRTVRWRHRDAARYWRFRDVDQHLRRWFPRRVAQGRIRRDLAARRQGAGVRAPRRRSHRRDRGAIEPGDSTNPGSPSSAAARPETASISSFRARSRSTCRTAPPISGRDTSSAKWR